MWGFEMPHGTGGAHGLTGKFPAAVHHVRQGPSTSAGGEKVLANEMEVVQGIFITVKVHNSLEARTSSYLKRTGVMLCPAARPPR